MAVSRLNPADAVAGCASSAPPNDADTDAVTATGWAAITKAGVTLSVDGSSSAAATVTAGGVTAAGSGSIQYSVNNGSSWTTIVGFTSSASQSGIGTDTDSVARTTLSVDLGAVDIAQVLVRCSTSAVVSSDPDATADGQSDIHDWWITFRSGGSMAAEG